jgi:hypothetical protein
VVGGVTAAKGAPSGVGTTAAGGTTGGAAAAVGVADGGAVVVVGAGWVAGAMAVVLTLRWALSGSMTCAVPALVVGGSEDCCHKADVAAARTGGPIRDGAPLSPGYETDCVAPRRLRGAAINHVLKIRSSTHGCQHMVDILGQNRYAGLMPSDLESIADRVVETGRQEAVAGELGEPEGALAALRFADRLRRSAERLCQASAATARRHGASWRAIGEAVGGITPQGAEHRFSRAAKDRRSKASKVEWASKERRR